MLVKWWKAQSAWRQAVLLALLFMLVCGLMAGAAVAVVAVRYVPLPDWLAASAGLLLGMAAVYVVMAWGPDVTDWANRRRHAGRWAPRLATWDLIQLPFATGVVWLVVALAAVWAERA
ncbi:hypothetical protein [Streptomyces aurantiogriseus]|uniref:hypothetical protein n=1 Tax=Streptomyces aurantiogriseus TaxID=66870 RepID=UPI0016772F7F|nr:hypothetical protein [Streptomyces aurantiogriseus]